jgi:DNA invertase Pin-like site-specific DNA recombinase
MINKISGKCAIYCRVSKTEQNPENQLEILKTYCSQQNFKVEKNY